MQMTTADEDDDDYSCLFEIFELNIQVLLNSR